MTRVKWPLVWRHIWLPVPWFAAGLLAPFVLSAFADSSIVAFVSATGLVLGVLFASQAFEGYRKDEAHLETQTRIGLAIGQEFDSNRRRLEELKDAVHPGADGVPTLLVSGPFRLRGGHLIQDNVGVLDWHFVFLARCLAFYHNLQEAEGLRSLYALSLATRGPNDFALSMARDLAESAENLLEEMKPIQEQFDRQDYYRENSLVSKVRRRKP